MVTFFEETMPHQRCEYVKDDSFILQSLVVDDDFTTLKTVCRMLNALGQRTDSANCGEAAIQCLRRKRYDFVLTDWNMPDIDGYEIAKWLKRHAGRTKVIIMTGSSSCEALRQVSGGIVDYWLFKPFTFERLSEILRELYQPAL